MIKNELVNALLANKNKLDFYVQELNDYLAKSFTIKDAMDIRNNIAKVQKELKEREIALNKISEQIDEEYKDKRKVENDKIAIEKELNSIKEDLQKLGEVKLSLEKQNLGLHAIISRDSSKYEKCSSEILTENINRRENDLASAKKEQTKLESKQNELQEKFLQLSTSLAIVTQDYKEKKEYLSSKKDGLEKKLSSSAFADLNDFELAVRTEEEIETLNREISEYESSYRHTALRIEELEKETAGQKRPNLDIALSNLQRANSMYAKCQSSYSKLQNLCENFEERLTN